MKRYNSNIEQAMAAMLPQVIEHVELVFHQAKELNVLHALLVVGGFWRIAKFERAHMRDAAGKWIGKRRQTGDDAGKWLPAIAHNFVRWSSKVRPFIVGEVVEYQDVVYTYSAEFMWWCNKLVPHE